MKYFFACSKRLHKLIRWALNGSGRFAWADEVTVSEYSQYAYHCYLSALRDTMLSSLLQAIAAGYLATAIFGVEFWHADLFIPGVNCTILLQIALVGALHVLHWHLMLCVQYKVIGSVAHLLWRVCHSSCSLKDVQYSNLCSAFINKCDYPKLYLILFPQS